jgi:hypothetical protein
MSANEIALAEAAYERARAANQAVLEADSTDFAAWVARQDETQSEVDVARFALLAAYGMPDASVEAARAAYTARK